MIHAFSVQNFKSLKTDEIELLPLTILAGVNNAGKTTFIQSILEFVRYHENKKNTTFIALPILSNYKTKVLDHNTKNMIDFHMKLDTENEKSIEIDLTFTYNEKVKGGFLSSCKIINTDKDRILRLTKDDPYIPYHIYAQSSLAVSFAKLKEGALPPPIFEGYGDFDFIGFVPHNGKIKFSENKNLLEYFEQEEDDDFVSVRVNDVMILLNSINNLKYIGPLRNYPKEFYFFETRGLDIDSCGENTFEVLERRQNTEVEYFKSLKDTDVSKTTLLEAVQFWIDYFQPGSTLIINPVAENLIQVLINGHTINNSGFGFSQLLPIIVQALTMEEDQLLLLEQPEIHLHPELEYKLAYFMLCIVKNKRQIIAETHSEHIVNQLIMSKMEDEVNEQLFRMYFLKKTPDATTEFEKINITEYGELKEWPEGFFDKYLKFTKELVHKRKEKALKQSQAAVDK